MMVMLSRRIRVLLPFLSLVLAAGSHPAAMFPQGAGVPAKLIYSRTFKGSTPEYIAIRLDATGSGTYEGRKLDESPAQGPRPFQLSSGTTERIFALAGQLHDFRGIQLESHKKVANLGEKTFTYQQGGALNRVAFNYTENRTARDLVDAFEAIGMVEQHVAALEFEMKYDPLNLSQELLQIQAELKDKTLTDLQMLVPTLEKIAHGSRFLHLAQSRAQEIIDQVQPGQ
jgi:hypothetical protein